MANEKLKAFIGKLKQSDKFVADTTAIYLSNNVVSGIIEEFNRKQLAKGEDALGSDLGEYSEWRKEQRVEHQPARQTEFIDLRFDGNFYESIYAEGKTRGVKGVDLIIDSSSPEDWRAIKEDGRFKDALGLQIKNSDKVGVMIADHLTKELTQFWTV